LTSTSNIYDSGTNVGIGTTSPTQKLEVAGNVNASIYYDRDNSGFYLDPTGTSIITNLQATGSAYLATSTGAVGIGTTSPTQKLEVAGNINASVYYDRDNSAYYLDPASTGNSLLVAGKVGINTTAPQAILDVQYLPGNQGTIAIFGSDARVRIIDEGTDLPSGIATIGAAYGLGLYAASGPLRFYTGGTGAVNERMRIDGYGNVGIGTNSPARKLHVAGGNITVSNDTVARSDIYWDATNNRLVIRVA
jgi:hypothetical protein